MRRPSFGKAGIERSQTRRMLTRRETPNSIYEPRSLFTTRSKTRKLKVVVGRRGGHRGPVIPPAMPIAGDDVEQRLCGRPELLGQHERLGDRDLLPPAPCCYAGGSLSGTGGTVNMLPAMGSGTRRARRSAWTRRRRPWCQRRGGVAPACRNRPHPVKAPTRAIRPARRTSRWASVTESWSCR